jgi:hypothetical protein
VFDHRTGLDMNIIGFLTKRKLQKNKHQTNVRSKIVACRDSRITILLIHIDFFMSKWLSHENKQSYYKSEGFMP